MAFEISVGLMVGGALAFLVWPLLHSFRLPRLRLEKEESARAARETYRQHSEELNTDISLGRLSVAQKEEILAEFASAILSDDRLLPNTDGQQGQESQRVPKIGMVISCAAIFVIISALGTYRFLGDYSSQGVSGAEEILQLDPSKDLEKLLYWRNNLIKRVTANQEDAKSWYLLGHARLLLQSYSEAAEAFESAHKLMGSSNNLDVYWLQSLYLAAEGKLDQQSRRLIERILLENPVDPVALEILAIEAFKEADYASAVRHLNTGLSGPLSAPQKESFTSSLAEARSLLGVLQPTFDLEISVISGSLVPNILFVTARPVGGGKPFIAIRRYNPDFPLLIRLDDAISLDSALPFSGAGEVELVVRLGASMDARAKDDDWVWISSPQKLKNNVSPKLFNVRLSPPDIVKNPQKSNI